MSFFEEGSPFLRFLNKVSDLLILNLLTLLFCVPVVTAGASLTAMHYVLLKMVRGEEGYIAKAFFRSFKRNFRQATVLWLLYAAVAALMASNLYIIAKSGGTYPMWLTGTILAAAVLEVMFIIYTFSTLARFENTVFQTLINAVTLTFAELPRSVEMAVITIVPLIAFFRVTVALPLLVLFGLSVPGYACAMVYDPIFREIEKKILGEVEEPDTQDVEDS